MTIAPNEDGTEYELYWGGFHKHLTGPGADIDRIDEMLEYAKYHLDICAVHCYPFEWRSKGWIQGIREESVRQRERFVDWWETVQNASKRHLDPGTFVTFPAHEWHGNRTKWGDHNIYYYEEGQPLDDEWDLRDLYENVAERDGLVIPHHTGYEIGNRGKDLSIFDEELSPVMEMYSNHGSSEGVNTPVEMTHNVSMGPRTSGGTYRDALDRGYEVGAIASNDQPGLPGTWNKGVAGVWAEELTRESVWKAIKDRRTYAVMGDRIALWWSVNDRPMGSKIKGEEDLHAKVDIECPQPLDRIELLHNGRVIETYCHQDHVGRRETDTIYNVLVEFWGGPWEDYGDFDDTDMQWEGDVSVTDGEMRSVYPRFVGSGQRFEIVNDGRCHFDLVTSRDDESLSYRQGLIFELATDENAELAIQMDGHEEMDVSIGDAIERSHLFPLVDESYERIETEFGITEDDIENPDIVYHNARKVKVHRAHPRSHCVAEVDFRELPVNDGQNYYYVRASQVDGQYAWSSPIWVEV